MVLFLNFNARAMGFPSGKFPDGNFLGHGFASQKPETRPGLPSRRSPFAFSKNSLLAPGFKSHLHCIMKYCPDITNRGNIYMRVFTTKLEPIFRKIPPARRSFKEGGTLIFNARPAKRGGQRQTENEWRTKRLPAAGRAHGKKLTG
ncbi:MAG: hypothetical protein AAB340_02990, partial [Patescibacteria group bacterium]